ncbi:MAG: site-specific integrase [Actinomycetota bacterium]|nr:site-specific integrase [Actinomycetota bacterium]
MASIRKKSDTAWLVSWREGGRDSKKRYRQFRTEAEALAFKATVEPSPHDALMAEHQRSFDRGEMDASMAAMLGLTALQAEDPDWSVVGYLRRMIAADRELRDTTRTLYERNIRVHLDDTELGKMDVRHVTPDDLTRWWAQLDAGVGARRNVHQLISKVLKRAMLVGDIEANPLARAPEVKRPKAGRREEVEPLTVDQIEALAESARRLRRGATGLAAAMGAARDRLEVLVMAYGGLRAGEVGGLRVQDMRREGDACQLRIRQAVVRETGKAAYVAPPKTSSGRRVVSIPCSLADEIEAFVSEHATASDGRVFHGPNGEMRAHNDINHNVSSAAKAIGMDVNAHQLRHTAVSLLIDAGANPKSIQAFIGHADIRETLQTYGHLFDTGGAQLAEIMESLREEHRTRINGE